MPTNRKNRFSFGYFLNYNPLWRCRPTCTCQSLSLSMLVRCPRKKNKVFTICHGIFFTKKSGALLPPLGFLLNCRIGEFSLNKKEEKEYSSYALVRRAKTRNHRIRNRNSFIFFFSSRGIAIQSDYFIRSSAFEFGRIFPIWFSVARIRRFFFEIYIPIFENEQSKIGKVAPPDPSRIQFAAYAVIVFPLRERDSSRLFVL